MKRIFSIFSVLCFVVVGLSCVFVKPVNAENSQPIDLEVKSAYLLDYDSGTTLFELNPTQHLPVASMVKLMTILLTFEEIDAGNLNYLDEITTSENASGMGGSQVFIDPYVNYKVEDLLKSVIVASANDASVALAEKISGSEEAFVEKMNKRAKELGMLDTNYVNCTGLPAPMQYSCAKDIANLDRIVISHKDYFKFSTIWMDTLIHPSGRKTELVNTNKLIRYYKGCDCGKTGSTNEAGYCLTASAKKGDMRLIGTIIGAKDSKARFNETSKLLNYGFANYTNTLILDANKIISTVEIKQSEIKSINVVPCQNFYAISKRGESDNFELKIDLPKSVKAPINIGDELGKVYILKDGQVIGEVSLIAQQSAQKLNYSQSISEVIKNWRFWG